MNRARPSIVAMLIVGLSAGSAAQSPFLPRGDLKPPAAATPGATAQQQRVRFGGEYGGLDARRQRLVDDWADRRNEVTGQDVEAAPFYDTCVKLSAKTTFDAVTHALMTTTLTDASGARLGDALDLIDRVESREVPLDRSHEYGNAFGMTVRFLTRGGDAPVLRMIWRRENGAWRITVYDVEIP